MALIKLNDQSLSAVTSAGLPSGSVLQVQSTHKTNSFTNNSGSFVDVTDLSVNITPISTSSKIYVFSTVDYSADVANYNNELRIMEDSTEIMRTMIRHNTGGNMIRQSNEQILRSPSTTSQLTYKVQVKSESSSVYVYINLRGAGTFTGTSTITAMEIAG